MTVNEIKKEVVVKTEYIACDGTIFGSLEECMKYEQTCLCACKMAVKPLRIAKITQDCIYGDLPQDDYVEIFNIATNEDKTVLYKYIIATLSNHCLKQKSIDDIMSNINVTVGHDVLIWWNCDEDYVWSFGDGSFDAFLDVIRTNYTSIIEKYKNTEKT